MSLYDDIDTDKKSDNVAGWASGIKFLHTNMQLKNKSSNQKRDTTGAGARKPAKQQLGPVVDFKIKSGKDDEEGGSGLSSASQFILPSFSISRSGDKRGRGRGSNFLSVDPEWQFENEYDPLYPNEYEKALKDQRERRDREAEEEEAKRRAEIGTEEEDDGGENTDKMDSRDKGVSIAPPASLNLDYGDELPYDIGSKSQSNAFSTGGGANNKSGGNFGGVGSGSGAFAAAKIMAKYGYKEGQGLGKKEQGMATALQVEKTSHRIGRIIHEKDLPKEGVVNLLGTPPNLAASYMDDDEFEMDSQQATENSQQSQPTSSTNAADEAEAAEQLRNPSKVVLLTNMVGPGEVDDDLEPEVKEECLKYGEVVAVIVFQMPDVDSEDSIRIFVEFAQVGSAVKAFLDLNGRFFGGRQVKASFYDPEKFNNLELTL